MFESIWKFIQYWYFRYTLVTELYMVEKWERTMIHIVFLIVFTVLYFFNSRVVLGLVELFLTGGSKDSIIPIQPEVIVN